MKTALVLGAGGFIGSHLVRKLKEEGFWGYTIHQKVSSGDLTVSGLVLEEGYMFLNPATPFEPTKYEEQNNNFVTYGL